MEELIELFQQIQELAGVGVDVLTQALSGEGAPPEGGAAPEGAPAPEAPPAG